MKTSFHRTTGRPAAQPVSVVRITEGSVDVAARVVAARLDLLCRRRLHMRWDTKTSELVAGLAAARGEARLEHARLVGGRL